MKLLNSHNETVEYGISLGASLKGGEIITLSGQMGSGKTTLVKGIAKGLGIHDSIVSPTFSIMNVYNGRLTLHHYDAYRLSGADEFADCGLDEFLSLSDSVSIIEWPEIIKDALKNRKIISISIEFVDDNTRRLSINNNLQN